MQALGVFELQRFQANFLAIGIAEEQQRNQAENRRKIGIMLA